MINENRGYVDILKQLTIAVAEKYYTPQNILEQHSYSTNPRKRFVKASKTNRFRIGMFRTTKPYPSGIEEIIAENAVIIHENNRFDKSFSKQKIQCKMKELNDLKQAIEEIINNILPE
ncbi:MAG: hypothetical protein HOC71_10495 [Candidatus Latescibacteria bacterium]|nr:hypothetical protein [Candidatus Latescibacterota bacterium]